MIFKHINHHELFEIAQILAHQITPGSKCFAMPGGGIPSAYAVKKFVKLDMVENIEEADIIINDIFSSNEQKDNSTPPKLPTFVLFSYAEPPQNVIPGAILAETDRVVLPWDNVQRDHLPISAIIRDRILDSGRPFFANNNISEYIYPGEIEQLQNEVQDNLDRLLRSLVIDINGTHTKETAKRVAKMYIQEVFSGRYDPMPSIIAYPNTKKLKDIYTIGPMTIRSTCSHHLLPVYGKAWIGIAPSENILGLSKFIRIVDWVMSRPQIQEEAVVMIADIIEQELKPKGLAIIIKAVHMCMTMRGIREFESDSMVSMVVRGTLESLDAKKYFLELIKSQGF